MIKERQPNPNMHIGKINILAYISRVSSFSPKTNVESHIHNTCEIYVNFSGNVSFMVENRIYRIKKGDIIITRPNEAHHCICHNSSVHEHFCMRFSSDENEELLDAFFDRERGEGNLISLPDAQKEKLIRICCDIAKDGNKLKRVVSFFNLLEMIYEQKFSLESYHLPQDVENSIDYINKNLAFPIKISQLAEVSHVTVNTLERHFKTFLGISPYEYIRNCRFAKAVSVLENGGSVSAAAEESGFPDYSHFIAQFRKKYGKTPLQFKKEL